MGFLIYMIMNIFVLSLPDAKERREYMMSVLNKHDIQFQFIDSLSPEDIDSKLFENTPYYLSKEAVATFQTHLKALELVKISGEITLILEDDATPVFKDVLDRIDELLKTDIDYDIMLIGYQERNSSYKKNINKEFLKQHSFIGFHSYIVKPEKVDKLISLLGNSNEHIDKKISNLISSDRLNGIFTKKKLFNQNTKFATQIPKRKN